MGERFLFKKEDLPESIFIEHCYRYQRVVPYLYGEVVDLGCGGGYGSEILLNEPNVSSVRGFDYSQEAVTYAQEFHVQPGLSFNVLNLESATLPEAECAVAIEIVEHLHHPEEFIDRLKSTYETVALSTPIIPTVHMNPWHLHDFTADQVQSWFADWKQLFWEIAPENISGIGVWTKEVVHD